MGCGSTVALSIPLPCVVFAAPSVTAASAEVRRWCSSVHVFSFFVGSFWMSPDCLSSEVWSSTWSSPVWSLWVSSWQAAGWGVRSWRRRARLSQTALPSLEVPGQEPLLQDMGGTRGVSGFSGPDSPSPLECVRRELSNIRYRLRSASSEPVEQRQQLKHREGELRKLHLEYMRRRDPFHKNRQRALIAPERALETLQGYVYLHLLVSRTKGTWRDGRASLHFDVFINDERWDSKKRCPIGMGIALHIHSPLSIVRVALMDGDSERDFVGFVEFRVCDLPQCGKEPIRVGDFVRVTTDEAALRRAFGSNRAGSVAWNSGMRRVLGTTQEVLEVSEDGSSVGLKGAMSGRDQPVLRYPVSCVSLQ
ncbi:unnamed protein product, partial [Prorocentrum cordatum]